MVRSCHMKLADGLDLFKQNPKTIIIIRSKEKPQITEKDAQLVLHHFMS